MQFYQFAILIVVQAVASGVNTLTGSDQQFQVHWLEGHVDDIPSAAGRELLRTQPELQSNLGRALIQYTRENTIDKVEVIS